LAPLSSPVSAGDLSFTFQWDVGVSTCSALVSSNFLDWQKSIYLKMKLENGLDPSERKSEIDSKLEKVSMPYQTGFFFF
jgi:hypothetical protein